MTKSLVYTCTGDNGTTSLVGGVRAKKNDIRIEAYGSVDELNANLGVLATFPTLDQQAHDLIIYCQHKLMNIGAYLATPYPAGERHECEGITLAAVERIEKAIDHLDEGLPPMKGFILPGAPALRRRFMCAARCAAAARGVSSVCPRRRISTRWCCGLSTV